MMQFVTMSTQDEYLKRFKQECRLYHFYQGRIEKIDQKIELVDLRMHNVQSPKLDKMGQTPTRHELSYPELITKKMKLQKDRAFYQEHMDWVKETIDRIPSLAYRSVVWYTYVERKSLHTIADTQSVSKDMLYKKRKKFVLAALSDEQMQKLDDIEKTEEE